MFTADDARKMREENTAFQKALKESVDRTIECIKRSIAFGRDYSHISTCYFVAKDGYRQSVNDYQVLEELKKYGYSEYRKPVYSCGVLQNGPFVTWL